MHMQGPAQVGLAALHATTAAAVNTARKLEGLAASVIERTLIARQHEKIPMR